MLDIDAPLKLTVPLDPWKLVDVPVDPCALDREVLIDSCELDTDAPAVPLDA